jgi:5-hydroxyisourate hydrolase-like protein (transthyretin family)
MLASMLVALVAATSNAQPAPLLELINPKGDGRLYTLSQSEADNAVARYGFQLVPTPTAFMWRSAFSGSQPIYRLRYKVRHSYLLTPSLAERDSLIAGGQFEYEGIAGYTGAMTSPRPPGQTTLWRYSKEGVGWLLVVEEGRAALERQGLHRDGPLGYVYATLPASTPPPAPPPSPDPCDPAPAAPGWKLTVAGKRVVTVRYGRRLPVRGRLRGGDGKPVAGASVCVASQSVVLGAQRRRVATVTTSKSGRFTYKLATGASRRLSFVSRVPGGAVSKSLLVQVRAPVSLRRSKARLRNGEKLLLRGRVGGGGRDGLLVELQAKRGRSWQTFATTHTGRRGRYRYAYRFTRTFGTRVYRLRARVPQQRGYAFVAGASRQVRVRVSG